MTKKFNLTPKSDRARRLGHRVRNVTVDMEEGGRMFMRFEGWNRWVWVQKKGDPHYKIRRGWVESGFPFSVGKGGPTD